jgi:ubiquinone biosynthesis UbiH/UbiF/VisC/COQ6 family hydroxylase
VADLRDCDAVVAGAGLVGAAAALGLADRGFDVLLLEPRAPALTPGRLGIDIRNVAVSPASRSVLEGVAAWQPALAAPYRCMEVWEERGTRAMIFEAAELDRDELGWIVEHGPLALGLWQAAQRHPRVAVRQAGIVAVTPADGAVTVAFDGGSAAAALLVAADGARSDVRTQLGVETRVEPTGQTALATAVRTERPHQGTALQRFLLDGPVALLPSLDGHVSSVVWSQSEAMARQRLDLDDDAFAGELARAVSHRLGEVVAVDARLVFPLRQLLAGTFNPHSRVLLIGDAAHVLHPLAGLGANVGFEDVRDLLRVVAGLPRGADLGADGLWRGYDRRRVTRARMMLSAMDALRRVYARGDPLSQWLRNSGVAWLNRALPIKRQIVLEAMGLGPLGRH